MHKEQFSKLNSKKILATGGAGFRGSNLCKKLIGLDECVVSLDNFATGKRENLSAIIEHPNFTLIEGDLRNLENCHKAAKGVDYIFHEAALGSVSRSLNDPITNNAVNVSGFFNMLVSPRDEIPDIKYLINV